MLSKLERLLDLVGGNDAPEVTRLLTEIIEELLKQKVETTTKEVK